MTAEGFVEHLRTKLSKVAAEVDRTREANLELMINERGEPVLKKWDVEERISEFDYQ